MESTDHAKLGPSSAHRWMSCPASVRLCASLAVEGEDSGSGYAAEGTAAHTIAEISARLAFGLLTERQAQAAFAAWKGTYADAGYDLDEMLKHAATYIGVLRGPMSLPYACLQVEVRGKSGIEGVWGTADAVITDPDTLTVVDYKYGQGVRVDATDNPQLKLYALGAWEADLLGTATTVRLVVVQPRLDHVSVWEVSLAELLRWRDEVARPAAELTADPDAPFGPGEEACRFCPVRGQCKAQMQWIAQRDFGEDPETLTLDDYAEALAMLPAVRAWASIIEERALELAYSKGEEIPGWKAVMSGGKRVIPDPAAAIKTLVEAGYDRTKVERPVEPQLQTLAALDKLVGKKILPHILGDLLEQTPGKPALVTVDDGRPAVTANDSAAADFAEIDD